MTVHDVSWHLDQDTLIRYAAVARDFNRIHYDAAAAREAGFERPIAHGMLTLGRALTSVVDLVGPHAIRASTARFSAPALVDSTVTASFALTDTQVEVTVRTTDGNQVLSCQVRLGPEEPGGGGFEPTGELVADRWLVVEKGPVVRFAEVLGAASAVFLREDVARAAGHRSVPVLPTYGFVLPGWGYFPELTGNESATVPDAVRDCANWTGSEEPVVHAGQAFTYSRLLQVGDLVRSRSLVVRRTRKERRGGGALLFTEVHHVLTDPAGEHVSTSVMTLVVPE